MSLADVESGASSKIVGSFSGSGRILDIVTVETGNVMEWLEKNRPSLTCDTAIVAGHNLRLFCLTSAFSQLGLRAGRDFGLASMDDESGLLASFPELSMVSFPRLEIGKIAGRMMIDMLAGNGEGCRSVEVVGEWIAGTTTQKLV